MTEKEHLSKGDVWELYERIEKDTLAELAKGHYSMPGSDPKLDDIIIEGEIGGKKVKLIGQEGCSHWVYRWDTDLWNVAYFEPDSKVPFEESEDLLKILEGYFGKPTEIKPGSLVYKRETDEEKYVTERVKSNESYLKRLANYEGLPFKIYKEKYPFLIKKSKPVTLTSTLTLQPYTCSILRLNENL